MRYDVWRSHGACSSWLHGSGTQLVVLLLPRLQGNHDRIVEKMGPARAAEVFGRVGVIFLHPEPWHCWCMVRFVGAQAARLHYRLLSLSQDQRPFRSFHVLGQGKGWTDMKRIEELERIDFQTTSNMLKCWKSGAVTRLPNVAPRMWRSWWMCWSFASQALPGRCLAVPKVGTKLSNFQPLGLGQIICQIDVQLMLIPGLFQALLKIRHCWSFCRFWLCLGKFWKMADDGSLSGLRRWKTLAHSTLWHSGVLAATGGCWCARFVVYKLQWLRMQSSWDLCILRWPMGLLDPVGQK